MGAASGSLVIFAFLGNLFIPLSGPMLTIAKFTPLYGYSGLARYPLSEGYLADGTQDPLWLLVANVVVWLAVFGSLAVFFVRRGRGAPVTQEEVAAPSATSGQRPDHRAGGTAGATPGSATAWSCARSGSSSSSSRSSPSSRCRARVADRASVSSLVVVLRRRLHRSGPPGSSSGDGAGRRRARRWRYLAVLLACTVGDRPAHRGRRLGFLPVRRRLRDVRPAARLGDRRRRRSPRWSPAAAAVLADPDEGTWSVAIIVFAVGVMTGGVRLVADRGEDYERMSRDLAIVEERERVARDVHDVLGHSLTVVTVKAELAERLVDLDPERAKAELAEIQALSRQALAEIRATVVASGRRAWATSSPLRARRSPARASRPTCPTTRAPSTRATARCSPGCCARR